MAKKNIALLSGLTLNQWPQISNGSEFGLAIMSHFSTPFTLPCCWSTKSYFPFPLLLKFLTPCPSFYSHPMTLLPTLHENWSNLKTTFADSQHHIHPPTSIAYPCSAFLSCSWRNNPGPYLIQPSSCTEILPEMVNLMSTWLGLGAQICGQTLFWLFLWGCFWIRLTFKLVDSQ